MKTVSERTQETAVVDIAAFPKHTSDTMCRILIGCVDRMFRDPAVRADYERWQKERQQKGRRRTTKKSN